MNISRLRFVILVLCCGLMVLGAGCTRNIQVSKNLPIQNPPMKKITKKVLVVMSREQAESVILEKPGALSDNFRIEAGSSISSNVVMAMKALFESADFSHEYPREGGSHDAYVLVNFKNHRIEWGSTAFSPVNMNVFIDYQLLDKTRRKELVVSTDGSSTWRRTGGEAAAVINPFVSILLTDSSLGRAWDQAVANSISQWVHELQKYNQSN